VVQNSNDSSRWRHPPGSQSEPRKFLADSQFFSEGLDDLGFGGEEKESFFGDDLVVEENGEFTPAAGDDFGLEV
jgi:hypothetical protein